MPADRDRDCPWCGADTKVLTNHLDPERVCTDDDCNFGVVITGP